MSDVPRSIPEICPVCLGRGGWYDGDEGQFVTCQQCVEGPSMPGSVSDSYDPEFGSAANADQVRQAVQDVRNQVSLMIGSEERHHILTVVRGRAEMGDLHRLDDRTLRIIRFCLDRSLETI